MFKMSAVPTHRKAKVEFAILGDFGKLDKQSIDLDLKVEDIPTVEATRTRILEETVAKNSVYDFATALVHHYVIGWGDVYLDDDEETEFSHEALDELLTNHETRVAVVRTVSNNVTREDLLTKN